MSGVLRVKAGEILEITTPLPNDVLDLFVMEDGATIVTHVDLRIEALVAEFGTSCSIRSVETSGPNGTNVSGSPGQAGHCNSGTAGRGGGNGGAGSRGKSVELQIGLRKLGQLSIHSPGGKGGKGGNGGRGGQGGGAKCVPPCRGGGGGQGGNGGAGGRGGDGGQIKVYQIPVPVIELQGRKYSWAEFLEARAVALGSTKAGEDFEGWVPAGYALTAPGGEGGVGGRGAKGGDGGAGTGCGIGGIPGGDEGGRGRDGARGLNGASPPPIWQIGGP